MKKITLIIIIAVSTLVVGIFGGIIGNKVTKDGCDCRKKNDAGWMGFSTVWFLGSVAAVILSIIFLKGLDATGAGAKLTMPNFPRRAPPAGAF
jgi:hypothetical protein